MAGRLFRWQGAMRQSVISQTRGYASKSGKNWFRIRYIAVFILFIFAHGSLLAIPTFSSTSSDELNQALDRFRQDLFIPFGLPRKQRMSIFKEKHAQRLRDEPVTVTINESEEYTLQPKKWTETPKKEEAIRVIKMMQADEDYKNFIPFVSALWGSQYVLGENRWQQIIRKAREAGALPLIIECARQSKSTGLLLRDLELVQCLFYELHVAAQKVEFKGSGTVKALNMAKQAVDIMDADLPDHSYSDSSKNPKSQPLVIATLLELSAARAINDFAGKDQAKEVIGYVRKLLACAPKGHYQNPPSGKTLRKDVNNWVREASTVYSGLRQCLPIHGVTSDKALYREVLSRLEEVKKSLKKLLEDPKNKDKDASHWNYTRDLLHS
jgi:hypothetical protein